MKYLFIDDMPEYLKTHVRTLRKAEHTVELARDIGIGWAKIRTQSTEPFDLAIIDLAMDREIREFDREHEEMGDTLRLHGYGDLPRSGQALGLRLWRLRKEIHQRYCYITNHPQLWLDNLGKGDPEFEGKTLDLLRDVVLDKSDLWSGNIEEKFRVAHQVWEDQHWI
ncbi:MAG: hypothetical protein KJO08_06140 [Gammaproteobacteria bacterium]|nr:hypothetical protein [Gammaproteobacteria bacterium]NNJ83608.1 hypothetical protein [Gammaproteobacteria bacterium]